MDFGIGDEYWLEGESQRRGVGNASEPPAQRESAPGREKPAQVVPSDSEEEVDSLEASAVARREEARAPTRPSRRTAVGSSQTQPADSSVQSTTRSQAGRATASTTASGKRPAAPSAQQQPTKRSRTIIIGDSDESEDELKFRFGRRR